MFQEEGSPSYRGIAVAHLWHALLATGEIELDRVLVAQGKGAADYLKANPRVRRQWDEGRYDLVHVHYGLTGLATLMLPSSARMVASFYGSDMNLAWSRAIAVATTRRARRRVFVSQRLADRWPDARNRVIPNGIDFDRVRPLDRAECCRALGLDPAKRWILFGGAPDNAVKQYPEFQNVMELVRREVPSAAELVLTGGGTSHASVVQKLNAADVLLFTSRQGSEGSPTIVKEAIVVGTPVVTVDVGDVREMLAGVEPSAVVPWPDRPSDPAARAGWREALARRVVAIVRDPRRSNGRELHGFLRQEEIARRVLAVYREALA